MHPPQPATLSLLVALALLAPCFAGEPVSALDKFDPSAILAEERAAGQPRDLVGLLGSHRGRDWGYVYCLAYSPDGKALASADEGGRVLLWPAGGKKLAEWEPAGQVHGLAFAPDGRHLATANANGTVYLLRLPRR